MHMQGFKDLMLNVYKGVCMKFDTSDYILLVEYL